MNVEIITNKKALSTVRNKKKELKDLDNHAWESGDETSTSIAEALDSVNELETDWGKAGSHVQAVLCGARHRARTRKNSSGGAMRYGISTTI